jgi:hypothetical protein
LQTQLDAEHDLAAAAVQQATRMRLPFQLSPLKQLLRPEAAVFLIHSAAERVNPVAEVVERERHGRKDHEAHAGVEHPVKGRSLRGSEEH